MIRIKIFYLVFPALIVSGCFDGSASQDKSIVEKSGTYAQSSGGAPATPEPINPPTKRVSTEPKTEKSSPPIPKASDIEVISVKVSQEVPDNYEKAIGGTWIYVNWKNNSKAPVREIWGRITVFNSLGKKMSLWNNHEIPLYSEQTPIKPGKLFVSYDMINGFPQFDTEEPVRATVTITKAMSETTEP